MKQIQDFFPGMAFFIQEWIHKCHLFSTFYEKCYRNGWNHPGMNQQKPFIFHFLRKLKQKWIKSSTNESTKAIYFPLFTKSVTEIGEIIQELHNHSTNQSTNTKIHPQIESTFFQWVAFVAARLRRFPSYSSTSSHPAKPAISLTHKIHEFISGKASYLTRHK